MALHGLLRGVPCPSSPNPANYMPYLHCPLVLHGVCNAQLAQVSFCVCMETRSRRCPDEAVLPQAPNMFLELHVTRPCKPQRAQTLPAAASELLRAVFATAAAATNSTINFCPGPTDYQVASFQNPRTSCLLSSAVPSQNPHR